jgi:hypothetical protein
MNRLKNLLFFILITFNACINSYDQVNNLGRNLANLYHLSDAESRSISPENLSGEKGKGGMAIEGSLSRAARELGQGWKINPLVIIKPGEIFTMADITGSGVIKHIWMTPTGNYRLSIFRIFWDNEKSSSIEVPVGDFFLSGWGFGNEPEISSLAICVNPSNGFNSYWQMPFRKSCKVTMENRGSENLVLFYQIDFDLTHVPRDAAYFHAQFRRSNPLPYKEPYTIVDGIKGKGLYVGTYLSHGAYSKDWWGEGEAKFFIDGDKEFPTICGTGEEDYFNGSYCYKMRKDTKGQDIYTSFSSPYSGFYYVKDTLGDYLSRVGQYRWHISDPISFRHNLKLTIQSLGWQSGGRFLPLEDDMSSVAYWYQIEPHNPFPEIPSNEKMIITGEK